MRLREKKTISKVRHHFLSNTNLTEFEELIGEIQTCPGVVLVMDYNIKRMVSLFTSGGTHCSSVNLELTSGVLS